jgi:hypothetical protein
MAQLVARMHGVHEAAGSSPASPTSVNEWCMSVPRSSVCGAKEESHGFPPKADRQVPLDPPTAGLARSEQNFQKNWEFCLCEMTHACPPKFWLGRKVLRRTAMLCGRRAIHDNPIFGIYFLQSLDTVNGPPRVTFLIPHDIIKTIFSHALKRDAAV